MNWRFRILEQGSIRLFPRKCSSLNTSQGVRPSTMRVTWTPRSRSQSSIKRYRSEEHTSELQSRQYLACRRLLEKKIIEISTFSVERNKPITSVAGGIHYKI